MRMMVKVKVKLRTVTIAEKSRKPRGGFLLKVSRAKKNSRRITGWKGVHLM